MKSIKVILQCESSRREGRMDEIGAVISDLATRHGAEVNLETTSTEKLLISADLVGFSREESSAIRAELRSALGEVLA